MQFPRIFFLFLLCLYPHSFVVVVCRCCAYVLHAWLVANPLCFSLDGLQFCSVLRVFTFFFSSPIFVDAVLLTAVVRVRASVCIVDWMATLARKKNKFSANPSHIWYLSCLECIIWQCCVLCWCIELATLPRAVYLNSSVLWFAQGDRRFARLLAVRQNMSNDHHVIPFENPTKTNYLDGLQAQAQYSIIH